MALASHVSLATPSPLPPRRSLGSLLSANAGSCGHANQPLVSRREPVAIVGNSPIGMKSTAMSSKSSWSNGASPAQVDECLHCGNTLLADSVFCRKCGHRRGADASAQPIGNGFASARATSTKSHSPSPQPDSSYEEKLLVQGLEARIRNLEAALEASRSQHTEDVNRLQATADKLGSENMSLRAQLAEAGPELDNHRKEVVVLQEQVHQLRLDAANARRQMQTATEQSQLHQSMAIDRELVVAPLAAKVEELTRELAVSKREAELMAKDLAEATRRASTVEAKAVTEKRDAENTKRRIEDALQLELREAREQAAEQLADAARRERLLSGRVQLLQASCFRSWWCLDSGMAGLEAPEKASQAAGAAAELSRLPQAGDPVPTKRLPIPADWRSILRFQAQLFHWLSAETARSQRAEFAAKLESMGEQRAREVAAEALKHDDEDEDFHGALGFEKFLKCFRGKPRFIKKVSKVTGIAEEEFHAMGDQEIQGIFTAIDADGSGKVTLDEFVNGLMELRHKRHEEDVKAAANAADAAEDFQLGPMDLIHHDEFVKMFRGNAHFLDKVSQATGVPREEFQQMSDDALEALFKRLDHGHSDTAMTFQEFLQGLVEFRHAHHVEEMEQKKREQEEALSAHPLSSVSARRAAAVGRVGAPTSSRTPSPLARGARGVGGKGRGRGSAMASRKPGVSPQRGASSR